MSDDNKVEYTIEEQDISVLKKKKIKLGVKKTIVGIIIAGVLISTIPNVNFNTNLFFAKHNSDIAAVVNSNNYTISEKAKKLFEDGIFKNSHLSEIEKDRIISSFESYVIDKYSDSFTEKYLYNIYASAKTVNLTEMLDFSKKHGWWGGDFNSYLNNISVWDYEGELVAHEFLHASLKNGMFGTGFTSGIKGYGFNEGITSAHVDGDYSYFDEYILISYIGSILGIDKVEEAYFNGDLNALEIELNKYLSKEESQKLISNCDKIVFLGYLNTFLTKLGVDCDDFYFDKLEQYEYETIEILKILFVNKTGLSVTDSTFGRNLFGKGSLMDSNTLDYPFYYITFADSRNYLIDVHYFHDLELFTNSYIVSDLSTFDLDKALEDITKIENNFNNKNK